MTKKIFFIALIFLCTRANAQNFKMKLANSYFESFHYSEAIEIFEDVLSEDSLNMEAMEKLAKSYRKIHDTQNAERLYTKLAAHNPNNSFFQLYLAEALASNGKYDKAKDNYANYAKLNISDSRGEVFVYSYDDMQPFFEDSSLFSVRPVNFNSDHSEFSPMYYKDGLVFPSNRGSSTLFNRVFGWNQTPYLDLYYRKDTMVEPEKFSSFLNSKFHEGAVSFTKYQDTIYFTRNNYFQKKLKSSDDGINKLKMFSAVNKGGKWADLKSFPYNDDQYSLGNPALSPDNKTIYFVSDMPGSIGGTDLFKSTLDATGNWSKPENLGKEINSEGNEMFPFVDAKNTLFYSSDGKGSLGGLDVFCAPFRDGKFAPPRNVGYPMNSSKDDFGIIVNSDETNGYFSSNRLRGLGDDDIYQFNSIVPMSKIITVRSIVMDPLKKPITGANITVTNKQSGVSTETKTNEKGKIEFSFLPGQEYEIKASKVGFREASLKVTSQDLLTMKNNDTIRLLMVPLNSIKSEIASLTGDTLSGDIKMASLNNPKTKPENESKPLEEDTSGVKKEFKLEKDFVIQAIYYNFDKHYIRKDAALQLEHVADIMKQYPDMKVEMYSHTDARGSDKYNYKLSQKRASAAKAYLVHKGISGKRLKATFYGEKQLVNRCANHVRCTKEEQQQNRRTEFKIVSY